MALYTSILNGGTNSHPTTSEEANYYATDFVNDGVLGTFTNTNSVAPMTGAFAVNAQGTPDMTVAVTAGAAYVTATPSGQASQTLRVRLSANENVTITSNSSGSTKYDWVYLKIDPTTANNPNLAGDDVATLVTSRSTSSTTDDGTPPTYGLVLAVVTVANGASSITNGNIRDKRVQASATSVDTAVTTGWIDNALPSVSSVTANGNRSYTIAFASTVASQLSAGMRLKTERTSAATTNAFSLDGSNDYYVKTSPNKLSFTDDFAISAWVYVTAYQAGAIASRYNGTSGWVLQMAADGTLLFRGYNGASGNYSGVAPYQSLPLNRWVHIAVQLDMSAFTATTTTSYVMIDGVNVPAFVARAGTNPTALVQAGNLEIGSFNGGTNPFPGYIDQVAIYNAKVPQATILASMNQPLTGSETSLASAYSNGSTSDLNTTTPNDLTATNGATTVASAPWGNRGTSSTLDYALVMSVSGSNVTVQVPEGCTIPTTGGVSAVAYSNTANPYGFVSDSGRWWVQSNYKAQITKSSPAANTWYSGGTANGEMTLSVPVGSWDLGYQAVCYAGGPAAQPTVIAQTSLSTSNSSESDADFSAWVLRFDNPTTSAQYQGGGFGYRNKMIIASSVTPYYLLMRMTSAGTSLAIRGDAGTAVIRSIPSNL